MKQFTIFIAIILCISCNHSNKTNPEVKSDIMEKSEPLKSLVIERQLPVKPEVVYNTFTEPEMMKVWWTPTTEFDMDIKVGGTWTITRTEGEETYVATGEYLKVEQPNLLKYTYGMPQFSEVVDTITIKMQPEGKLMTKVTFIQSGKGISEELNNLADGDISQSEQGWNYGFDLMIAAWETK